MTSFAYRAARGDGGMEHGVLEAVTREAAVTALSARGLFPLAIELESGEVRSRVRMSPADLALGLRALAELLDAGLPINRALDAMREPAPAAWQTLLPEIGAAVREGSSLGRALEESPAPLPRAVIGIIRAGEGGSALAAGVRRAAEMMEESAATRAAIRSALAYPAVLGVVGLCSIAMLVGIILPRFAIIIADLGGELPRTTRLVLEGAELGRRLMTPMMLGAAAGAAALHAYTADPAGRSRWHALLLRVPLIGAVRRSAAAARTAATLAALLESGVPLPGALTHAAPAGGDAALAERLAEARARVNAGERLSVALDAVRAMTPTTVQLVRVGEETGRLGPMLAQAARIERARAERAVKAAVRLLEPALILAMAAVVALVAAALLQAVYGVRPV